MAYVIEGGVRRAGESVRINAQLIQVSDQTQLWGDSYTRVICLMCLRFRLRLPKLWLSRLAVELLPQQESARSGPGVEPYH